MKLRRGAKKSKFISEERKVEKFSDAKALIPASITDLSFLFEIDENSLSSTYERINESNIDSVYPALEYALKIRHSQTETILKLFRLLATKFGYGRRPKGYVGDLLTHQGLIQNKEVTKSYDEVINIFEEGSIERAIQYDDIDKFIELTSNESFNPNTKIRTRHAIFFDRNASYMQLMAFFGSIIDRTKVLSIVTRIRFTNTASYVLCEREFQKQRKMNFNKRERVGHWLDPTMIVFMTGEE